MSGDYSRATFDPTRTYSGVHKQQGRVSLDSEFNEFEEILDRRARATTFDIVGQAVVPITTKRGFEILVDSASSELTIGVGRAYVDGILAECFGDRQSVGVVTVRDDTLGGVRGSAPQRYSSQPCYYAPGFP